MQEQLFPFSKNRYFKKKRMRSVDFRRDQAFADGKLSFLSHWVFGSGVAMGLGVERMDSDSLLVEPGVAVDSQGRYLIVDEPAVCRVKALDGFQELRGEGALLWLVYREELLDPMFVTDDGEQSMQYAVARERYAFVLSGEEPLPACAAERAVFSRCVLLEDEDVRITQIIPRVLSAGRITRLTLSVECFCPETLELDLSYAPVVPGFVDALSGGPPRLSRRLRLSKGETLLTLPIRPAQAGQAAPFTLAETALTVEKRGVRQNARQSFFEEFPVAAGDPLPALEELLVSRSPQELWEEERGVPIAGLRFVRCGDKCLLDDVIPFGARNRVAVPYLRESLRRAGACYEALPSEGGMPLLGTLDAERDGGEREERTEARWMTSGSVQLNAGVNRKAGSVLTSDEIAHGLGPGTVYVEFGIEDIYPLPRLDRNRTELLLGDISLFEQAGGTYDRDMDRGVRVHPDKGTFEMAVRLGCDLHRSMIRLRWFAWKPEEDRPKAEERTGKLLRLTPDVVHAVPGEVLCFIPVFTQGEAAPCDFFTADKQGGAITRDGVYTAPSREGLYQVCAQVQGQPEERANAFIIVKARENADEPNGV